jgi:predicted small metal-binding protein
MMKFECKDLGTDCDYVATAGTKREVMDMASAHAVEIHGDMLKDLTEEQTDAINAKIESLIQEDNEDSEEATEAAA